MLVSATCAMPRTHAQASMVAEHSGMDHTQHAEHGKPQADDCSLKPCPNPESNAGFGFKLDHPQLALVVLCLGWLILLVDPGQFSPIMLVRRGPPPGKPCPLIYRYCILLN